MNRRLGKLDVVLLDCQTTGASPLKGSLLEVGWCVYRAETRAPEAREISSVLVRLPERAVLPGRIARMTGIDGEMMKGAKSRGEVWGVLAGLGAGALSGAGAGPGEAGADAIAVAHFARFEKEFIADLHSEVDGDSSFPFRFVCTHELAKRLLPRLPRRGLRALAGYFGNPLPEWKRAASHVAATAHVWRSLVDLLRTERGITSLDELLDFLDSAPPARKRGGWSYPLPREKRLALPDHPGVYRFLGGAGEVLYIGKAASLKSRVNSYYRKRKGEDKLLELVSQVRDVEVTLTETALGAALLEAEEIRRIAPAYNRALRDRGQGVWFHTADLTSAAPSADDRHTLGPLPHEETLGQVRALFDLLRRWPSPIGRERDVARKLGIGARWFEGGAVREGFHIFREKYCVGKKLASPGSLLALGSELWRARLAEEEAGKDGAVTLEPQPDEETDGPSKLDGDGVARYLEGLVCGASRLLRRARWLTLLAESEIRWKCGESEERGVVVREGIPGGVHLVEPGSVRREPPGREMARLARLTRFDRARYDCLRVLNTEIRRLVTRGDDVRVFLAGDRVVTGVGLRKVMKMV